MTPKDMLLERISQRLEGKRNCFALLVSEDDDGVDLRAFFETDVFVYKDNQDKCPESFAIGMSICNGINASSTVDKPIGDGVVH